MKEAILHLDRPATTWDNGTPLGSGRMGMMIMGDPVRECIYLNEESIWAGGPPEPCRIDFKAMVAESRRLFLAGCDGDVDAYVCSLGDAPFRTVKSYEYAGRLYITLPDLTGEAEVSDYRRDLDLMRGVATITYTVDGIRYRREAFSSHPANLQVVHCTADAPTTWRVTYERENLTDGPVCKSDIIRATAETVTGGHTMQIILRVLTDGTRECDAAGMTVTGATILTVYIAIATDVRYERNRTSMLTPDSSQSYESFREEHIRDFSAIMSRTDVDFTPSAKEDLSSQPVSARLDRLRADPQAIDPALWSLYHTFGKYLLVSSSREDSLPANLQGVWSEGLLSPWGADYHTNINLQMNYWHAEAAGLDECVTALFGYMNNILLPGAQKTAAEDYGMRGAVVHHLSDIYGFSCAADAASYGLWPVGGAWLCFHLWEHYLYTEDADFLREVAYPFIRACALFFMDYLFEDGEGHLLTGPSMSPENQFYAETSSGERRACTVTMSPTMDNEIVGGLLRFYAECERILSIHPTDGETAEQMAARLPPPAIGKHGQLMEWIRDYDESEPGHRHISHAFGLYPAASITRENSDIWEALKVTFARRLANGGGHSGWSRAWFINFYARLGDGKAVGANIRTLLTNSTLPNLLDNHPPFQIDGNFGGAAGMQEMLLQSHEGCLSILPALPPDLPAGSFTALRARGRYEVDASWTNGEIRTFTIRAPHGRPAVVALTLPDGTTFFGSNGQTYTVSAGRMTVPAGETLTRIIP